MWKRHGDNTAKILPRASCAFDRSKWIYGKDDATEAAAVMSRYQKHNCAPEKKERKEQL
jgi:hypothetical protein